MPTQPLHVTTAKVARRDAFSFWQDVICETFIHLDCTSPQRQDFHGDVRSYPLAKLQLSSMTSNQINLTRSKSRIASAPDEYCLAVIQGQGRTLGEQDGRQVVLNAGDIALFDSVRPYRAELQNGFQHLVLKIPRQTMQRRLGPVEVATATRIAGNRGMGLLASSFVRTLSKGLVDMDEATASRAAETALDLISAAFSETIARTANSRSSTRAAHLVRAKSHIAANLHECDLSPGRVAVALGISVRYLNALFAESGTSVARYIWQARIERCRHALSDPFQAHRSISEIAYSWGFNDLSHFSKMFRESAGTSAREFRRSALLPN